MECNKEKSTGASTYELNAQSNAHMHNNETFLNNTQFILDQSGSLLDRSMRLNATSPTNKPSVLDLSQRYPQDNKQNRKKYTLKLESNIKDYKKMLA